MTSFKHLLTDVCTVAPYTGTAVGDPYKSPTYGPKEKRRCAYVQSRQKVRDSAGVETVSAEQLAFDRPVGEKDKVWMPNDDDADDTVSKTPIAIRNDASRRTRVRLFMVFF